MSTRYKITIAPTFGVFVKVNVYRIDASGTTWLARRNVRGAGAKALAETLGREVVERDQHARRKARVDAQRTLIDDYRVSLVKPGKVSLRKS